MTDPQTAPSHESDGEHTSILGVQYPLEQPGSPLRRGLKVCVGIVLGMMRPDQCARLARGEPGRDHLTLSDRLIVAALVWQHRRRGTLGELSGLHQWLWRSNQAVSVHAQAEARFRTWWLGHHSAIVTPLREAIAEFASAGLPVDTLCEIGCGSGTVLTDIATRMPELSHLLGLDLSPGQIATNRARPNPDARLRFEVADATTWIAANAAPRWAYLVNGGVLEYFSEAMLAALFTGIAQRKAPALFAVVEPIAEDYDLERETASRPYNAELSLGHNYIHWLRRCGWQVRFQQRQDVGGTRWLLVVAETGRTST